MNVIQRGNLQEPQPAIDTCCDHCGAIYDLVDCYASAYGNILCPDCNYEGFGENDLLPEIKMSNVHKARSRDYKASSFYVKQYEWYEKIVSLTTINKIQKLLKINLLAIFRKKQPLAK